MSEKIVLIRAQPKPVTAEQNTVNQGLRSLYEKYKQKLGMIKTPDEFRAWAQEMGVEDVDWFFGEVLMMVHPSFVAIGPELYNRFVLISPAFKFRDSWLGLHLKLGHKEEPKG